MKRTVQLGFFIVGLTLLCAGCAQHYNITTTSGHVITTHGKPRYDKAHQCFVYTDAMGVKRAMPAGSVTLVAPASDRQDRTGFNAQPAR